jgi:predicted RNA-binding Zn-ribbon protein involved in translation (DUF1610 family)
MKCPRCGERLLYARTEDDVVVYHCPNDGVVLHTPDGQVRVVIH